MTDELKGRRVGWFTTIEGHKLKFWASCEIYKPASDAEIKTRRCVEPYLNAAFAKSSLANLECEIRYVPIIMPTGMRERYPARSRVRRKEHLYDCAPQLNFIVFVDGSFEEQLAEYLRGIAETGPHLVKLGASPEQVCEFKLILAGAAKRILLERPDQARN